MQKLSRRVLEYIACCLSHDTGRYDNDGSFYITDRLKELIKVKGLQVAPAELEAVLVSHPKITDAAVTSVQNERLGEAPKAFVVKKDERLTEMEIQEYMASKVSQHYNIINILQTVQISAGQCQYFLRSLSCIISC